MLKNTDAGLIHQINVGIREILNYPILENSSKSHMKMLHVFNVNISINAYVFLEYFLNNFRNFSYEFHMKYVTLFMWQ